MFFEMNDSYKSTPEKKYNHTGMKVRRFTKNIFRFNNLKRLLYVWVILFSLLSCTFFSGKGKCERLIEKEKMVEIMTDLYLLEAYIQITARSRPEIQDSLHYLYAGLFKKHDISRETFNKALECYSLDRDKMAYLNEEVLNNISIIESRKPAEKTEPGRFFPEELPREED